MSSKISQKLAETLSIVDSTNVSVGQELVNVDAIVNQFPDMVQNVSPAQYTNSNKKELAIIQVPTSLQEVDTDVKQDYVHSRNIHYTLVDMVGEAMQEALILAKSSGHPKAYDTFNALANTLLKVADSEMNIQKVFKDVTKESQVIKNQTVHNTQVNITKESTVASTTDIINMIEEQLAKSNLTPGEIRSLESTTESLYTDRIRPAGESIKILGDELDVSVVPAEELPKPNGRPKKGAVRR